MARKAKGAKRCGAVLDKKTGRTCGRWAAAGEKRCWICGSGSRKRVIAGKRKMAGGQIKHGRRADPKRQRWDSLGNRIEDWKKRPEKRIPDEVIAVQRAAFDEQLDLIINREFRVMKTPELMEDPLTWIIQNSALLIEKLVKVNSVTYKDPAKAAITLVEPLLRIAGDIIDQLVPEEFRTEARQRLVAGVAGILTPNV